MDNQLEISIGQYSHKGRKELNQDFHEIYIPKDHLLTTKGIAIAIADGISSSEVSQEASKVSIITFLQDYFATSESWSVKKSANTIINTINSWLYSKNRNNLYHLDKDKGYVCTFSSMILKSTTAYIFHIGDVRIYRLHDTKMEQLTEDHRLWISKEKSYLSRALGIDSEVNIDFQSFPIEKDDIFIFATDGVYEFIDAKFISDTLKKYENDLDTVAKIVIDKAYENGSDDNLTIQIVKVDNLPNKEIKEIHTHLDQKPLPPILEENQSFDGFKILKQLAASSRSHVYLGIDEDTNEKVVIKIPSIDLQNDEAYLERFLLEDWIAKKINNSYVAKAYNLKRKTNFLYNITEFIEGSTLEQWMKDNPKPSLDKVRNIVEQLTKGLLAFHKLEMIHKDLRPQNIMIDSNDIIKIIDFGSTKVEGITEINTFIEQNDLQGTALYSAPEYFTADEGTHLSDMYSLGAITYELISNQLPYGVEMARTTNKASQNKLVYNSLYPDVPIWIDETLKKSLSIDPNKRYSLLSEFLYDLSHPNKKFLGKQKQPLIKRNPMALCKIGFLSMLVINIYLLITYS